MFAIQAPFDFWADKDGDPLDAGYIYLGQPNQDPETHPVAVFWDAAGTIPAQQPIRTLNGYVVRNGTPSNAYVAGDYSLTVRNRKLEIVYTLASVNAAAASSSDTMEFLQGGAGAVSRSVQDKLREAVSVKDFGAKGDGATDDTSAINAAAAYAFANRKALFFPAGVYKITAALDWTAWANIVAYGEGWASTTTQNLGSQIVQFSDNTPILRVTARPDIQCLSLRYANQQTLAHTNSIGLQCNKLSGAFIRNVRVYQAHIGFGIPQVDFGSGSNFIFNSAFIGVESWKAAHTHYDLRNFGGGGTNCYFGPLYMNGEGSLDFSNPGQSCEYGIRMVNTSGYHFTAVSIDGLVFNQTLLDFSNNPKTTFTTLRFESVKTTLNGGFWVNLGGGHAQLDCRVFELYNCRSLAADGVNTTSVFRTNATEFDINIGAVRVGGPMSSWTTVSKRFFRAGGSSENSAFNNSGFVDENGDFPAPWSDDQSATRTVPPIRTFGGKTYSTRTGNAAAGTAVGRIVYLQSNQAPGSAAWSAAGGFGTKPWLGGDRIIVQDFGDLGRVMEWGCMGGGTPGTWVPAVFAGGDGSTNFPGDADATFTPLVTRPRLHYQVALTANRTLTLDAANAWNGLTVSVSRPALGGFNLDVGGLKTLAAGQWCEVFFDGTAWRLGKFGSL